MGVRGDERWGGLVWASGVTKISKYYLKENEVPNILSENSHSETLEAVYYSEKT